MKFFTLLCISVQLLAQAAVIVPAEFEYLLHDYQYETISIGGGFKVLIVAADELAAEINFEQDLVYKKSQNIVVDPIVQQLNPQNGPLSRISQREFREPIYSYPESAGRGTSVYVLDTGVNATHQEFLYDTDSKCRSRVRYAPSIVGDSNADIDGHGTFVAAIVGGTSFGVAKNVSIVAVKVLDNFGSGNISTILRGLQWSVNDIEKRNLAKGAAVINLSLGGIYSRTINRAISSISDMGIIVVSAAGNEGTSSCLFSPASSGGSITVGSILNNTVSSFSNVGRCVDIFAPGELITSALFSSSAQIIQESQVELLEAPYSKNDCIKTSNLAMTLNGTSFSAPMVAGVIAIYQSHDRLKNISFEESGREYFERIKVELLSQATTGQVDLPFLSSSPNKIAYVFPPGLGE